MCSGSLTERKLYVQSGLASIDVTHFLKTALTSEVASAASAMALTAASAKPSVVAVANRAVTKLLDAMFRIGSTHEPRVSVVLRELLTALDPTYFRGELALLCQLLAARSVALSDEDLTRLVSWFSLGSISGSLLALF